MSAHLIVTIDIATMKVVGAAIYSHNPSGASRVPRGYAFAELTASHGISFSTALTDLLRYLVDAWDYHRYQWVIPLVLAEAHGRLWSKSATFDAETPLAEQGRLWMKLWELASRPELSNGHEN